MHINNVRRYFLDTMAELVGIKSGLAVSIPKAVQILDRRPPPCGQWWHGGHDEGVRLDAGDFQSTFIHLLQGVGGISDADTPTRHLLTFIRRNNITVEEHELSQEFGFPAEMRALMVYESAVVSHLLDGEPLPLVLAGFPDVSDMLREYSMRYIMCGNMPIDRKWDGVVPLNNLFESEQAPSRPDTYFDQRFIDYLNAQLSDLTKVHWRQFEYLAGEYFHRRGYDVTIGPGRDDGGKDVVAKKVAEVTGPELVYVQCRRYSASNKVTIDEVKAFYQTVNDDCATRGLIATTSQLAFGARKYCDARRYRLNAAEKGNVVEWLKNMKSA